MTSWLRFFDVLCVVSGTGRFIVTIRPAIAGRHDIPRREAIRLHGRDYAAGLEPLVVTNPEQWRGWRDVRSESQTQTAQST